MSYITLGLVASAAIIAVDASVCRRIAIESAGGDCAPLVVMTLPIIAGTAMLGASGVMKLVEAYKERNNT